MCPNINACSGERKQWKLMESTLCLDKERVECGEHSAGLGASRAREFQHRRPATLILHNSSTVTPSLTLLCEINYDS